MSPEESYGRMDGLIEELRARSKFKERKTLQDGREVISSPESGEFFIRRVQDAKDPAVRKIHEAITKEFSAEEADTIETIKAAVENDIQDYRIVEDAQGRLVALANAEYLEMESSRDMMIFVG